MEEEVLRFKILSLAECDKLLLELKRNREDAELFFGGELYRSYVTATDAAIKEIKKIRTRIRNL